MNKCIEPNTFELWQLDAYLDGVSLPGLEKHLQKCFSCRQKLNKFRKENEQFSRALFRLQCPDTHQLLNYAWDLLDEETSLRVAIHMTKCPHCRAESERLSPPPIQTKVKNDVSILQELQNQLRLFIVQLQPNHQLATVRFDEQAKSVMRGHASSTKVYKIEELDLNIILNQWVETDKTCTIQGQLLGIDPEYVEAFQVSLLLDEERITTRPLNTAGVFSFSSIACNRYNLCFHTPQVQFCILDVTFPAGD